MVTLGVRLGLGLGLGSRLCWSWISDNLMHSDSCSIKDMPF